MLIEYFSTWGSIRIYLLKTPHSPASLRSTVGYTFVGY